MPNVEKNSVKWEALVEAVLEIYSKDKSIAENPIVQEIVEIDQTTDKVFDDLEKLGA